MRNWLFSRSGLLAIWLLTAPVYAMYLLLRPSPRADQLRVLPKSWSQWLDEQYNFRTFLLALLVCLPVAWLLRYREFNSLRRRYLTLLLGLLVAGEVAQIWIPHRVFDWVDLGFTVLAVITSEVLVLIVRPLRPPSDT